MCPQQALHQDGEGAAAVKQEQEQEQLQEQEQQSSQPDQDSEAPIARCFRLGNGKVKAEKVGSNAQ